MKKRMICALLAVLLCVSLLPVSALAAEDVKINKTNFPDPIFREYVSSEFDKDGNGVLSQQERKNVYEIMVYMLGVSSLTGIEHFPYLRNLCCAENNLKTLDVSKNTELTVLECNSNKLTALDVSKNTKLEVLYCENNKLTTLDIRNNPKLIKAVTHGHRNAEHYYIVYSTGEYELTYDDGVNLIYKAKPAIISQPADVTVRAGQTVTFKVNAAGVRLKYQWYCKPEGSSKWTPIDKATKATYSFTSTAKQNGNKYRCKVTNEKGSVVSSAATLTVVTKPKITTQPAAVSVKAGSKVVFKVKATGGALTYQWYFQEKGSTKWNAASKATKATYSFTAKKEQNGRVYRCRVKNIVGGIYTKSVKLTVK